MVPIPRPRRRPAKFLASVVSAEEAAVALAGGADIIDCKNPSQGALGALPHSVVRAIVAGVGGRAGVSATIGDVTPEPETVVPLVAAMAGTGVDLVKIGFFPGDRDAATISMLGRQSFGRARLVGLLLADMKPDLGLVRLMADAGFAGVMLDTAIKDGSTLFDHAPLSLLVDFVGEAHDAGLFAGLAGSLRSDMVNDLLGAGVDVLGFRGALCDGARREGALSQSQVTAVARAMQKSARDDARARMVGVNVQ
ncbi:MAG: (5-formylfuran-3-yl)methyl phosphate synthase [Hyphomicrobium sp.]|nr:(5-formylfuran-3-yl)methyl phosphate synthase [Hyphomicrobium sp.]